MADKMIEVVLKDHSEGADAECTVRVTGNDRVIEIYPKGYGTSDMEDGYGPPVALEFYEGRLRLLVNADINEQEHQVIDLEEARETNRVERED